MKLISETHNGIPTQRASPITRATQHEIMQANPSSQPPRQPDPGKVWQQDSYGEWFQVTQQAAQASVASRAAQAAARAAALIVGPPRSSCCGGKR